MIGRSRFSQRGLAVFSLLLGVAAIGLGVFLARTAWALRANMQPGTEPLEISVEDFRKDQPKERWLKLTDCDLFLDCAIFATQPDNDEVMFLIVPMWSLRQRDNLNSFDSPPKTSLALLIDDPQVIAAAKEPPNPMQPGISHGIATSFGKIGRGIEPLEGVVGDGGLSQEQRATIRKLGSEHLSKDYQIFVPGRPWTSSGANAALALALLPVLLGLSWVFKAFTR